MVPLFSKTFGTVYGNRILVTRGGSDEAREAFDEQNSQGMLLGRITMSSQGYKEGLLICWQEKRWEDPVLFPTVEFANILPQMSFRMHKHMKKHKWGWSGWRGCQTPQAVIP